jgi:hypothetical protein
VRSPNWQTCVKPHLPKLLILFFSLPHLILAGQRELPPASAQRILRSGRESNPFRLDFKKPAPIPRALSSTQSWQTALPCPIDISRYGFAQVGNDFYVISGLGINGIVSTDVYRYNVITGGWTTLAPIPVGSEGPVATYSSYDNKIYVADGYGGQNLLRIYNIASNSWTNATARPGVTDSFGGAAGAFNAQINIAGGNSGGSNTVLSNYNIPNGVWTTFTNSLPSRFYGGGFAQLGRLLYLIGGYGLTSANSNASMRLDMAGLTWTTGPTFTPQKADFALAAAGSKLFAIGGDASGGGFFDPSSTVDELETGTWPTGLWVSSPNDLPSSRQGNSAGFFSALRMGGEIWSTGGITSNPAPHPIVTEEHLFRALPCPSIFFVGSPTMFGTDYPSSSGTQQGNVLKNAVQSACGLAKPFPGISNPAITFAYDQYSFTNTGPTTCVTFTIDTACTDNLLSAVAYLGSYDPTNLARNYLGDLGANSPDSKTFSVNVPSGATVVLVVYRLNSSSCRLYHVTVTGLNCFEYCSNDGPILIPANLGSGGTSGPAGPYPSAIPFSGVPGVIGSMSVELNDFVHAFSADIDMLLVSPAGKKMVLMSDVGSSVGLDTTTSFILRDAGIILPETTAIDRRMYSPTNYEASNDTFPSPAPPGPYNYPFPGGSPPGTASLFSSFAGSNPNGAWQLFINDDASGDAGALTSWCLKLHTIVLQLTNAFSRKSHNGKSFDIDLPLTGQPGVECRTGGAGKDHTIMFIFTTPMVSGSVSFGSSLGAGHGSISGSPTISNNILTVNVTGVSDQQTITLTLNNFIDVYGQVLPTTPVSMVVLLGDTTGNKSVNSSDIAQTKSKSGAPIDATNFRTDTNVNGSINASDVAQVKANSGHGVP